MVLLDGIELAEDATSGTVLRDAVVDVDEREVAPVLLYLRGTSPVHGCTKRNELRDGGGTVLDASAGERDSDDRDDRENAAPSIKAALPTGTAILRPHSDASNTKKCEASCWGGPTRLPPPSGRVTKASSLCR